MPTEKRTIEGILRNMIGSQALQIAQLMVKVDRVNELEAELAALRDELERLRRGTNGDGDRNS